MSDEFVKELGTFGGTMQVRWIRKGYPDSILEVHEPGYYGQAAARTRFREKVLHEGIEKALEKLQGNELELNVFKARAYLLAALKEVNESYG